MGYILLVSERVEKSSPVYHYSDYGKVIRTFYSYVIAHSIKSVNLRETCLYLIVLYACLCTVDVICTIWGDDQLILLLLLRLLLSLRLSCLFLFHWVSLPLSLLLLDSLVHQSCRFHPQHNTTTTTNNSFKWKLLICFVVKRWKKIRWSCCWSVCCVVAVLNYYCYDYYWYDYVVLLYWEEEAGHLHSSSCSSSELLSNITIPLYESYTKEE